MIKHSHIKLHQLQDNDLIKIIPFVDKMGNLTNFETLYGIIIPGTTYGNFTFLDKSDGLIKKILSNKDEMLTFKFKKIKKYMFMKIVFNVYIDGEFKYIHTEKTLKEIINSNSNLYDLNSNYLLHIQKNQAERYEYNGYNGYAYNEVYDYYDESKVILDPNFNNPFKNLEDPYPIIYQNCFDIDNFVQYNQIINHNNLNKLKHYDEYNSLIELFELIKKNKREDILKSILTE